MFAGCCGSVCARYAEGRGGEPLVVKADGGNLCRRRSRRPGWRRMCRAVKMSLSMWVEYGRGECLGPSLVRGWSKCCRVGVWSDRPKRRSFQMSPRRQKCRAPPVTRRSWSRKDAAINTQSKRSTICSSRREVGRKMTLEVEHPELADRLDCRRAHYSCLPSSGRGRWKVSHGRSCVTQPILASSVARCQRNSLPSRQSLASSSSRSMFKYTSPDLLTALYCADIGEMDCQSLGHALRSTLYYPSYLDAPLILGLLFSRDVPLRTRLNTYKTPCAMPAIL